MQEVHIATIESSWYTASMKTKPTITLIAVLTLGLAGCQHGPAVKTEVRAESKAESTAAAPDLSEEEVREMKNVLESTPMTGTLFPEFDALKPEELASMLDGSKLLDWARAAFEITGIPETTYTLYRVFKATGERESYQRPYGQKRSLISQEALAVLMGGDTKRVSRLSDLLWSVCEETWWVMPAHEKAEWYIDLGAAQTGALLSQVVACLGDRLPEEIRNRVRDEVTRRILDPYLQYGEQYSWNSGRNNWTGVCAGAVGQAFLLLEPDLDRQARALALVAKQLNRFIENGFGEDGACLEGIGYWNYGLSEYIIFAEMMRARSAGKIDLLANEKLKLIAEYPLAVYLGHGTYASFADSHESASLLPYLAYRLAERTGVSGLKLLASDGTAGAFPTALRNLLWTTNRETGTLPVDDVFMPKSGVIKLVVPAGDRQMVLAAKAGHNAEPHNNNDVGSFIIAVDGVVYLCDPGSGLYNRDYFSGKRYENIFANSFGHSVPRIGGILQSPGSEFCGTMEKTGDKAILIRFEKAYKLPELTEAARAISLQDSGVTIEDRYIFDGAGLEVEEAFMTWQNVEIEGSVARVVTDTGILEIRVDQGVFAAERLEEVCKANRKSGVLTRLTVTYPAAPSIAARYTMAFRPKP